MMKQKRLLTAMALTVLMAGAAHAQDCCKGTKSFSYIEAQGGVQLTSTNAPMDKLITPTAALSFGHYFTPVVGARLHVNAWQAKSGVGGNYYKWKYITPDLDLMLNLNNMFCKKGSHALNVILLGGIGLNYAWDNDELKDLNLAPSLVPLMWDKNRLSHNLRAGLRLETDMSKPLGFALEVNANSLSDRFNSKTNDADDWQFTAMLGVSYRFGHKKGNCCKKEEAPVAPTVVERHVDEVVATEGFAVAPEVPEPVKPAKKAVLKKEPVKLKKEAFYDNRMSTNEANEAVLKDVANFMKEYPNAKVTIVGYANKNTGTPAQNRMYAKRRADQFKNDLVKKYGIQADRIVTDSKGDTVQPFADNDKNRCVIIEAEAVKEYTVYE